MIIQNIKAENRGSILIFTVLALGTMVAIAITVANLIIPKIKIVDEAVKSTIAVFAADSASEICLYQIRKETDPPGTRLSMDNGAGFTVTGFDIDGGRDQVIDFDRAGCTVMSPDDFVFRAVGNYRGINRAFELSVN